MKRLRRLLLGSVGVVLLLVGMAVPASAHAQLESTSPAQSSVSSVPPTQVVLHFGEPVEIDFGSLRVLGPNGQRVDNGGTHHPAGDSHAVAIPLPANLPRGTYVVAWRVISADSHPVHGAFVFSVGTASGASKPNAVANALANQSGSAVVGNRRPSVVRSRWASIKATTSFLGGRAPPRRRSLLHRHSSDEKSPGS